MANIVPGDVEYRQARDAAVTAIRINGRLSEAHRDLAWLLFNDEANLVDAEAEYRQAIALSPDDSRAHHWFAQLLMAQRKTQEALREATEGYELDPRSVGSVYNYGFMLIEAGQPKEGVAKLNELATTEPRNEVVHCYLGIGYGRMRDYGRSAIEFAKAEEISTLKVNYEASIAWATAMRGDRVKAESMVSDLERRIAAGTWMPGASMAGVYIALGDKDKAFYWLQRGVDDRSLTLLEANTEPIYGGLSSDPRFDAIVSQLHRAN